MAVRALVFTVLAIIDTKWNQATAKDASEDNTSSADQPSKKARRVTNMCDDILMALWAGDRDWSRAVCRITDIDEWLRLRLDKNWLRGRLGRIRSCSSAHVLLWITVGFVSLVI